MSDKDHNESDMERDAEKDLGIEDGSFFEEGTVKLGSQDGVELERDVAEDNILSPIETEGSRKYQVGEKIAEGGMGSILQAKDMNIRRQIAMKVMSDPDEADDLDVLRFVEEAQITGQLEHPNITPVHELGVDASGKIYFTMKMIKGRSLKAILKDIRKGKKEVVKEFPLSRLVNVFLKICDAIAFAHSKGVLHRDLKPENIMIGEFGEVLVIDWGVAKILGRTDEAEENIPQHDTKLPEGNEEIERLPDWLKESIESIRLDDASQRTIEGFIIGTPHFMAPEQAFGQVDAIDAQTDVYALGGILYSILTLRKPIEGESVNEVLIRVVNGEIDAPSTQNSMIKTMSGEDAEPEFYPIPHCPQGSVPSALGAVAMKALSRDKSDRYDTVQSLQSDIEAYQSGYATEAEEASIWRQGFLFFKRHKVVSTAGLMVFLSLLIGFTVALKKWRDAQAAELATRSALNKVVEEKKQTVAARKRAEEEAVKARREAYLTAIALAERFIRQGSDMEALSTLNQIAEKERDWEWNLLQNRIYRPESNVTDWKAGTPLGIWLSPDESKAVMIHSNCLRLIELATGKVLKKISVSGSSYTKIHVNWNNNTVILVNALSISLISLEDGRRKAVNIPGKTTPTWQPYNGGVIYYDHNTGIYSLTLDENKKLVPVEGKNIKASLFPEDDTAFTYPYGLRGKLRRYRLSDGKLVFEKSIAGQVRGAAPLGEKAFCVSVYTGGQNQLEFWESGKMKSSIPLKGYLKRLRKSPSGRYLSGHLLKGRGGNTYPWVYDIRSGKQSILDIPLMGIVAGKRSLRAGSISFNEGFLHSEGSLGSVLWDLKGESTVIRADAPNNQCHSIAKGKHLAVADINGNIKIYGKNSESLRAIDTGITGVYKLEATKDFAKLIAVHKTGYTVWKRPLNETGELPINNPDVRKIGFYDSSLYTISGRALEIWDSKRKRLLRRIGNVNSVVPFLDNKLLLRGIKKQVAISGHKSPVVDYKDTGWLMGISPDGKLGIMYRDRKEEVVDFPTGKSRWSIEGLRFIGFSDNSKLVVLRKVGMPGGIYVKDSSDGKAVMDFDKAWNSTFVSGMPYLVVTYRNAVTIWNYETDSVRKIKLGWSPRSFEKTGNYVAISSKKEVGKTIIISLLDDLSEELSAQGAAVLEKEDRLLSFRGRFLDIQALSTKKKILRIECSQPIQKIKALPDEKTIVILYANGKVGILDASGTTQK